MARLSVREDIDFLTKQLIVSLTGFQVSVTVLPIRRYRIAALSRKFTRGLGLG